MFSLDHILKIGIINAVSGLLVLLVGTTTWLWALPSPDVGGILLNATITFLVFTGIWFFMKYVVATQLFENLSKGQNWNKTNLKRLAKIPAAKPARRGLPLPVYEGIKALLVMVLVIVLTLALVKNISISLGGFAGGWLVGGALGKFGFVNKAARLEVEKSCTYYFSDPGLGPYTEISYFSKDGNPAEPQESQAVTGPKETARGAALVDLKKVSRSTTGAGSKARNQAASRNGGTGREKTRD